MTNAFSTAPQAYRGERLGLPADGPGALAGTGTRIGAFLIDSIGSALIAGLFVPAHGRTGHLPGLWSEIPFAIDYVVGILVAGKTLGMYLLRIRVVRIDKPVAVDPVRAVVRTALLCVLLPALVWDRDGRGLHDRFTATAVVQG